MRVVRGIEIGNIFQLGTFYSDAMDLNYMSADGTKKHPIMGCYGIGVGRTMAAILEESSNENGPVWNMETAPFVVHVIGLGGKDTRVTEFAQKIHDDLVIAGIETILDNRDIRAGEKFADADLIAAPIRLIVSDKNIVDNKLEVKYRVNDFDTSSLPSEFDIKTFIADVKDTIRILSHR